MLKEYAYSAEFRLFIFGKGLPDLKNFSRTNQTSLSQNPCRSITVFLNCINSCMASINAINPPR